MLSLVRTNMTGSRAARAVACLKFKKRAKSLHIKNAFGFKLIDAKSRCISSGHLSLRCLLYVKLADKSCNAQEKISCLFASLMRGYRRTARAMAVVVSYIYPSLRACDIAGTVAVGIPRHR